jgi:hypothetical protein
MKTEILMAVLIFNGHQAMGWISNQTNIALLGCAGGEKKEIFPGLPTIFFDILGN